MPWIPLQGYASFRDTLFMALNSLRINLGPNNIIPYNIIPNPLTQVDFTQNHLIILASSIISQCYKIYLGPYF